MDGGISEEKIKKLNQKGVKGFILGTSLLFGKGRHRILLFGTRRSAALRQLRSETRQRRRFLQVQFAVRLALLRGSHDLLQNLVKAGFIGVQRQLLGHEANRGVVDAVDLFNGVLHLGGTVGAVDFELVMLLHNSFLLILYL